MNIQTKIGEEVLATIVPLKSLRFGHDYPGADIHARRNDREAELKPLAASIANDGVLQSLLVCRSPERDSTFYVIAGNRRLAALQLLSKVEPGEGHARIDAGYAVPVIIRDVTPGTALALSLAESENQVPLHPIDRYEAFAAIEGTPAAIAARFGTTERIVRQSLALGKLSPKIRDAWRQGEISADVAKAFTLAPDLKDQEKHFAALKKQHMLSERRVREHIVGDLHDIEHLIVFVGKDDYITAGGEIIEDLFGEKHGVSDRAKLTALAAEKLQAQCTALVANGWAWAEKTETLPRDWMSWRRVQAEPKYTAEEKKRIKELLAALTAIEEGDDNDWEKEEGLREERGRIEEAARFRGYADADKRASGCAVAIDGEGLLDITPGIVMPKKVEKAIEQNGFIESVDEETGETTRRMPEPEKAKAKKKAPSDAISQALCIDLGHQLTHAASDAIAEEPGLAIAALLAGIAQDYDEGPMRLQLTGMHHSEFELAKETDFTANFKRYAKLKLADQAKLLAKCAGAAITLRADRERGLEDRALIDALDAKRMNAALRKRFDAPRYFEGVTKAMCLAAIEEAVGPDEARRVSGKPKGEIVGYAVANYGAWLPIELRTTHYDGPATKEKPKKATKAKPAKKKAKRK